MEEQIIEGYVEAASEGDANTKFGLKKNEHVEGARARSC
jgi:hypothetical protein